ncbi:PhzF family phenazine biosynthesis protein [Radicibacter daui]|uniref:PhzF family phenazine biosynthesis protein n=1 Tax=Radicibacter daui TaxID=3064829 RepID=UPI004046C72E
MELQRISAFSDAGAGGNPAGVAFVDTMPADSEMLATAAEVGYSETAFLQQLESPASWRVRYFAPAIEVPFCGHATIALGAALGARCGAGTYRLKLNRADITVEAARMPDGAWGSTLTSPATWSKAAPEDLLSPALALLGLTTGDLDPALAPALAHAGATHLVVPLASRARLAVLEYDFEGLKALMTAFDLTTVNVIHRESKSFIHSRNPFAVGGVVEDPATGAAAAALGGYLRDAGELPEGGKLEISQGVDMGVPSRLFLDVPAAKGSGVRVSGATRVITL